MRHKEFESIDAMTRENDNTSYSDVRVRDGGIFFKRFITDYYCWKKKRKKGKRVFKQALQYSCDNETDIGYRNKIMTIILESNWIDTGEEDELTGFVN